MKLLGKEPVQIKEAVRFARNAGRKSHKAKAVRKIISDYEDGKISDVTAIERINQTKPWQSHWPINP